MECEICGERANVYEVIFQGRRVYACLSCIKKYNLHIIRSNVKTLPRRRVRRQVKNILDSDVEELVEGYGKLIKSAREALGLTQEDLARELKVKLSYIKKIENERMVPTPEIIRKLEKLLNIKLTGKAEEYEYYKEDVADYSLTLGDLMDLGEEGE